MKDSIRSLFREEHTALNRVKVYLEVYRDCCDEFESWCKKFEFHLPADENFGCLHYEVKSND